MKKRLWLYFILCILVVLNLNVFCIHDELSSVVDNARQYERNFELSVIEGQTWIYEKVVEDGDIDNPLSDEEYQKMLENAVIDSPLGESEELVFNYFYDINGVYVYQQVENNGVVYTMSWNGETAEIMNTWALK